ncbi:hypothetical protein YC2023_124577 [Brassica napus]
MSSATVLDGDNYAAEEVCIRNESLMSSAQRRKLADISNLEGQAKQTNREETHQQQDILFSCKEYAEKLEKAFPFALLFWCLLWWLTVILLILGCK